MKLKKEQQGVVASMVYVASAQLMLELIEDNVLTDLPDGFDKTKAKFKEVLEVFNEESMLLVPELVED